MGCKPLSNPTIAGEFRSARVAGDGRACNVYDFKVDKDRMNILKACDRHYGAFRFGPTTGVMFPTDGAGGELLNLIMVTVPSGLGIYN